VRAYALSRFLVMASGKEKWMGDRGLTLRLEIEDAAHFGEIFGELTCRGWIVPEKEPTCAGVKRSRTRNNGYLLPFFHDDVDGSGGNVLEYSLERKRLVGTISLGYFGPNLKFVRGATPPDCPAHLTSVQQPAFDIATTSWVPRAGPGAVVFTEARVRARLTAGLMDDA
jgi:hypothetical protein